MAPSGVDGYAAMEVGQQLEPLAYPTPELREGDVRVSVSHCGVCFTDIQAIDDYYGITEFPFVPGHEIVGYVEARGREVSGLKEGDRVGIGWQGRSCTHCEWCEQGEEQLMTLRKRGRLALVGFPEVSMNSTDLVAHELCVTGSFLGNRATMPEMLSFAQAQGITPRVEQMAMADVNDAIRRLKENQARYRIVLVNRVDGGTIQAQGQAEHRNDLHTPCSRLPPGSAQG